MAKSLFTVVGSSDWAQMRDKNAKSAPPPIVTGGKASGVAKGKKTEGVPSQASFPPLTAPPVTNVHSVWEKKPSYVKSPWSAPPTSTAHTVWKTRQSTPRASNVSTSQANSTTGNSPAADNKNEHRGHTDKTPDDDGGAGKSGTQSSSSSSVHSDGDNTISAPSSAPSSPLLSPAHGQVTATIDVTEYDYDNDDEEITEETYHEEWETASAYQPSEASAPTVHIGRKGTSNRWEYLVAGIEEEQDEPAVQENLWVNVPVISPSTGSKAAAEAHAKEANEIICPVHKGKCKKGICEAYKELKRAQRKQKKNEEKEIKRNQKKEEGKKESGEKEDSKKTNERGTAEAIGAKAKKDEQPNNKGVSQFQDRNKKPTSRRWDDYSSDDDDLGALPSFSENKRTGGRKYDADEDFFD